MIPLQSGVTYTEVLKRHTFKKLFSMKLFESSLFNYFTILLSLSFLNWLRLYIMTQCAGIYEERYKKIRKVSLHKK